MTVTENAQDMGVKVPRPAAMVAELAGRRGRSVSAWLALVGESPLGLAATVTVLDGGSTRHSIGWLLVSRHARRRGIGTALVAAVVADARERGMREVWVETRADWSTAVAFWTATGFRPVP